MMLDGIDSSVPRSDPKKTLDAILALADDVAKLSTTSEGSIDVSEASPAEKQLKSLAKIAQKLVSARPIPGEESVAKDGKMVWKHKAATCLLFTIMMDLHRASDGYVSTLLVILSFSTTYAHIISQFSAFLGGPVVEKWSNLGALYESIKLDPPFSNPKLLIGRAKYLEEATAQGSALESDNEGNGRTQSNEGNGGEIITERLNRRANRARGDLLSKKVKKAKKDRKKEVEDKEADAPQMAPPPFFSRDRRIRDASVYNINHLGDGPKASGQGGSVSPR